MKTIDLTNVNQLLLKAITIREGSEERILIDYNDIIKLLGQEEKGVKTVTIEDQARNICKKLYFDFDLLVNSGRQEPLPIQRAFVQYWLYNMLLFKHREIAICFNKDRSTIYNSIYKIQDILDMEDKLTTPLIKNWIEILS